MSVLEEGAVLLLPLLPLRCRLCLRRRLRLGCFRFAVGGFFGEPQLAQFCGALAHGAAGGLVFRRCQLAVARLIGLALETRLGFRLGLFRLVAHGAPWPHSAVVDAIHLQQNCNAWRERVACTLIFLPWPSRQ